MKDITLAEAMFEVMETNPNRVIAIAFRDGTNPVLKTKQEKEDARHHYYDWLVEEAEKLIRKKKAAAPTMPTPGGEGKPSEPIPWRSGVPDSSFRDDSVCCCPDCRKAKK